MSKNKKPLVPKLRFPEFRGSGEWEVKVIDQISKNVIAGGTPSTLERKYWDGHIRWMNSGELNLKKVCEVQGRITEKGLDNSSTKLIPRRCVLIGLAGQGKTRGTVAINMVELCTNQSIAAIFPNDIIFDSDFLYHNLDDRYDELRRLSTGSEGRGGLNLKIIKSLIVNLPTLPEQQRIADCLSSLDERITVEAQKLDMIKAHKKGLMQKLFPAEGESVPGLRFPEFRGAGEWKEKKLGEICDVRDGTHDSPKYHKEGKPLITSKHLLSNGLIDFNNVNLISTKDYTQISKRSNVEIGDILFGMIGTIGNPVLVRKIGFTIKNVALIKQKKELLNKYLVHFLNSQFIAVKFNSLNTGNSQKFIALGQLRNLELIIPSIPEQQKIADCLSSLDELINAQDQKVDTLKAHKKGLMQGLFPSAGEVGV